jgi:hypothetical protein
MMDMLLVFAVNYFKVKPSAKCFFGFTTAGVTVLNEDLFSEELLPDGILPWFLK